MDSIQSTRMTESIQNTRSVSGIRTHAQQSQLPELTMDEETMIREEFDPEQSSVRYNRSGEASQISLERGRNLDWRG